MKVKNYNKAIIQMVVPFIITTVVFMIVVFIFIIPVMKNNFITQRKNDIKDMVLNVLKSISTYEIMVKENLITKEKAQELVKKQIASLRYGTKHNNYFWIIDTSGKVIINPSSPQLEGTNTINLKDANGKEFIKSFIDIATHQQEGGFVEYKWHYYSNSKQQIRKISFVKIFRPWNWIIGSGIYEDDIEKNISTLTTMVLVITCLLIIIFSFMASHIIKRFMTFEYNYQTMATKAKRTESKIKMMIQAIPDLLIRINKEGKILDVKEPIIFDSFIPPEKMLGANLKDILPKEIVTINLNAIKQTFETGEPSTINFQTILQNQPLKTFEAHFVKCGNDEILATYRDITKRI